MEFLTGVPGNFVDENGEQLRPMYKWQDAMGYWHEKELAKCTWSELYVYGIGLWNLQMSNMVSVHEVKKITLFDMLKMSLMIVGASTLLASILILVAMFFQ